MTVREAIHARHSVRAYKELPLADETVKVLVDKITELNQEGRLMLLAQTLGLNICRVGYTKMDSGIAKYHSEIGAGKVNFEWV